MSPQPAARIWLLVPAVVAGWPVWRWAWLRLGDSEEVVTSVVALGAALFLAAIGTSSKAPRRDLRFPTAALLLYAGTFPFLPPLGRAALYALVLASLLPALGLPRRRAAWVAGLLLLAVPVVPTLQFYGGYPLRALVAQVSSGLLRAGGIEVTAAGASLSWDGGLVAVDAPCSGVKMLWTGSWLVCVCGGWLEIPWRRGLVLAGVSLGLVLAANAVRAAALFHFEAGLVAAPGWAHSGVGLGVFATTSALIVACAMLAGRSRTCAGSS